MQSKLVTSIGVIITFAGSLFCGCQSPPDIRIKFASISEGQGVLLGDDPFLAEIQQSDITQRLCKERHPTMQSFRDTLLKCVLAWTDQEKHELVALFDSIANADTALAELLKDEEIVLVKTSGTESLDAFYTLKSAIILPVTSFRLEDKFEVLRHELFHILSRKNPNLRRRLYAILDYQILDKPIQLADSIRRYMLHNPDSPVLDYFRKRVDTSGGEVYTTVVLLQYGRCLFDLVVSTELRLASVNGTLEVQSMRSAPEIFDIPEEQLAYAFEDKWKSSLGIAIDSLLRASVLLD